MKDCMIDLETLGTDPGCVVASIGAVLFDLDSGKVGNTFHMVLDIDDQLKSGRTITGDTLKWWFQQGEEAKRIFHEKAKPAKAVLTLFTQWFQSNGGSKTYVWGNGASFDIPILENLYNSLGLITPWKYNKIMDLRTFKRFVGKDAQVENLGVAHNALDDAKAQAYYVIKMSKQGSDPSES